MRVFIIIASISICAGLLLAQENNFHSTLDSAGFQPLSKVDFVIQPTLTKPGDDVEVVNVPSSRAIIKWKEWDFTKSIYIQTPGKKSRIVLHLPRPSSLKLLAKNLSSNGRLLIRFVD